MVSMRGYVNSYKQVNKLRAAVEILLLFFADMFSLLVIFWLATFLRTDVLPHLYAGFPSEMPFVSVSKVIWIFPVWVFFFFYEGFYSKRFSFWDEIHAHWRAALFSTIGVFTIVSLGKLSGEVSRTVVVLMGASALGVIPVIRMSSKKLLRWAGLLRRRVLILGAGETGRLIARAINKEPNYGYDIMGYLDDDPRKAGTTVDGVKVHMGVDSAERYIQKCNITDIIIAMPRAGNERLQGIINELQHKTDRLLFVPDIFGTAVIGTNLLHFFQEQAFALELRNNLENPANVFAKRVFDYTLASVLSVLLAIPFLVVVLLIRATSKGPAIYRQPRVGKGGRSFMCYKFRTMYHDADKRFADILAKDPAARDEWEEHWKLKDDPRVTPIGRFLRSTSIDEFPQLLNVLMGGMSLVGPRPYMPREWDFIKKDSETILHVSPGITGLWQVSGRSNTGYEYRIALDAWYVRNWNLWLDIMILLKTVAVVLKREGAR
jgi:undecaprenyl-phosphate galactose phosphotransferase